MVGRCAVAELAHEIGTPGPHVAVGLEDPVVPSAYRDSHGVGDTNDLYGALHGRVGSPSPYGSVVAESERADVTVRHIHDVAGERDLDGRLEGHAVLPFRPDELDHRIAPAPDGSVVPDGEARPHPRGDANDVAQALNLD